MRNHNNPRQGRRRRNVRRAILETLESRQLLSSVTLTDGILTLAGDNLTGTEISVQLSADRNQVVAQAGDVQKTFDLGQIHKIHAFGGKGDDTITLDDRLTIQSWISAGEGDNTILGGGGDDIIFAGRGEDRIDGRGGHNLIMDLDAQGRLVAHSGTVTQPPSETPPPTTSRPDHNPSDDNNSGSGNTGDDSTDAGNIGGSNSGESDTGGGHTDDGNPDGGNIGDSDTGNNNPGDDNPGDNSSQQPVSTQVQAKIDAINQTTIAGGAVHVQATNSTLGDYDPLNVLYHWDFGDVDASGQAAEYNELDGFNAAHVYDRAGTYTITLTLTDPTGAVSVAKMNVTVAADTRRTLYVASNGNDANDGLSPDAPIRTLGRAQQLLGDNTRVLFKRGQTFTINQTLNVRYDNVLIGAYGQGDRPLIQWDSRLQGSISLGGHNDVVQGLAFDAPSLAGNDRPQGPMAIMAVGENLVVRDNLFLHVYMGVNGNGKPRGVLVLNNTEPLDTGLSAYLVWCEGSDYTILGNSVANSTREHDIRMEGTQRMNISYNDFTNLDRRSLGDSHDYSKTTIAVHANEYAWVAHNKLHEGPIAIGPLSNAGDATPQNMSERTRWTVVEGNELFNTSISTGVGAIGTVMRNNIIHPPQNEYGIRIGGYSMEYQRGVEDIRILNNTIINDSPYGGFATVSGQAQGVIMDNNLFVNHNLQTGLGMSALVYVDGKDLSNFIQIQGNVWDTPTAQPYAEGGYFYVWPSWSSAGGYQTPQEWDANPQVSNELFGDILLNSKYMPLADVARTGIASTAGVFTDFYGKLRPASGLWSAGAVQG